MSIVGNATTLVITLPTWLWAILGVLLLMGLASLATKFRGRY
jgi:hypothetical protein